MTLDAFSQTSRKNANVAAGVLALGIFFVYAFLAFGSTGKFDSPDETSNYFFSVRLARGEPMPAPMPPQLHDQGLTFPRNVWAVNNQLVPASFLGIIQLYGLIGRFTSPALIVYLTPFFSALAVYFFFALMQRIWGRRRALISTILFAFHPAFWYYSTRGLFHNALFLDLLVLGVWALITALPSDRQPRQGEAGKLKTAGLYAISGLAIGEALAVRTSESVWVLAVLLTLVLAFRKRIDFRFGCWFGLGALLLPLIPVLFENARLFGSPFAFGYSQGLALALTQQSPSSSPLIALGRLILPFGLNIQNVLINVWHYGVVLFWWVSVPTLLGGLMVFRELRGDSFSSPSTAASPNIRWLQVYGWLYLAMVVWLVLSYGSWNVQDNPVPRAVTIGTSYVRYWLPLYAFGLPYAAVFIERLLTWLTMGRRAQPLLKASTRTLLVSVLMSAILLIMTVSTVFDSKEGLATTRSNIVQYRTIAEQTMRVTPTDAVIVSGRGDKIFFPERYVIFDAASDSQLKDLRTLLDRVGVYVYVSPTDAVSAVRATWRGRGLTLGEAIELSAGQRLFRLKPVSK